MVVPDLLDRLPLRSSDQVLRDRDIAAMPVA
jgi:hypothetical protein